MAQILVDLDPTTVGLATELAKPEGKSLSVWLADFVRNRVAHVWPPAFVELAGAWPDFPTAEEIRSSAGQDASREQF